MNIVIDAFGGDNAPLEVIKGSLKAHKLFRDTSRLIPVTPSLFTYFLCF